MFTPSSLTPCLFLSLLIRINRKKNMALCLCCGAFTAPPLRLLAKLGVLNTHPPTLRLLRRRRPTPGRGGGEWTLVGSFSPLGKVWNGSLNSFFWSSIRIRIIISRIKTYIHIFSSLLRRVLHTPPNLKRCFYRGKNNLLLRAPLWLKY